MDSHQFLPKAFRTAVRCGALLVLLVLIWLLSQARHIVRHGSLFVLDVSGEEWVDDFPKLDLDMISRAACFKHLRSLPARRSQHSTTDLCGQDRLPWLKLTAPYLVKGGFRQWTRRWKNALMFLVRLPSLKDLFIDLFGAPIEQSPAGEVVSVAAFGSFVEGLQRWPANSTPVRPLYWAEASLVTFYKDQDHSVCPLFPAEKDRRSCKEMVEYLFQDFGWVGPMFGRNTAEVEVSLWAGPRAARTGLHADIEPFNLLILMSGRKRVTMWPPILRDELSVSGRFDASASISAIDVFDPLVNTNYPRFAAVRHLNFTVELGPGDALHIPAGWWHVAENLETSLAITLHVWQWNMQEYFRWLPHSILERLHNRGWYRHGWCTCHYKTTKLQEPYFDALGGLAPGQAGSSANSSDNATVCDSNASSPSKPASTVPGTSSGGGPPATPAAGSATGIPGKGPPKIRDDWALLLSTKSAYQALAVWHDQKENNRYLVLNGDIQLTSKGEFVYHEMLSYVPLAAAMCAPQKSGGIDSEVVAGPRELRAFVFGGGDGGIAQRLLWHPLVSHVLQVEIDEAVINASQEFFPQLQPDLPSPGKPSRHTLLVGDGIQFAQRAANGKLVGSFDVVILDTTDILVGSEGRVIGPDLFTPALYENLAKMLRPGGVLAQNAQSLDGAQSVRWLRNTISKAFKDVYPFSFATPDFASPFFSILALKEWPDSPPPYPHSRRCSRKLLRSQLKGRRVKYYSEAIHSAAFVLPAMLEDLGAPDFNGRDSD